MGELFGTDGVRGIAGKELSADLAMQIGYATGMVLTDATHKKPVVIIGKDTRISSDFLESAVAAGLCAVGADVIMLGVVPTPAVAYLIKKYGANAGVMISASHNAYADNGIKIFDENGFKLSDAVEKQIEDIICAKKESIDLKTGKEIGKIMVSTTAVDDYVDYIVSTVHYDCSGIKILVDCANGSASTTADKILSKLGVDFTIINNQPNGTNINENCGSTHLGALCEQMKIGTYDFGIAFDGDADRCLSVSKDGTIIDGDKMMAIMAEFLKKQGKLKADTIVVTVMSNIGFFKFAKEHGIKVEKTKVGDRYVLENMRENGYNLGGEQSGHFIFLDYMSTGDGQLFCVQLLSALSASGKTYDELANLMISYPQVLKNIKSDASMKAFMNSEAFQTILQSYEQKLQQEGRILIRASGTEPLIRVMIEGQNEQQISAMADEMIEILQSKKG